MRLLPAKKRTSSKVAKKLRTFMLKYALLKFIRAQNFESDSDEENGHGSNRGNGCKIKGVLCSQKIHIKKNCHVQLKQDYE